MPSPSSFAQANKIGNAIMDFSLSAEQEMFRDSVRGFAERHLRDGAVARANADTYPADIARLMAQQGLLGITIPEQDGGQGGTLMDVITSYSIHYTKLYE